MHAAHLLTDGGGAENNIQLCVDLRGYDVGRPPADPVAVLGGFLRRLGVPGSQLPHLDLAARRARFHELLAGRRSLLVLDNAASVEQVVPLIPGVGSCRVLVTSRGTLAGLEAVDIALDVFSTDEAVDALQRAAAPVTVDPTSTHTVRIVELVGHLPLAITLIGARVRGAAGWTLRDHAERLAESRGSHRLEAAVETALRLSYDRLPPEQRRLLRLVSTHPGRDLDRHAAAALAAAGLTETDAALAGLVEASIVRCREPGRYALHDLVRTFAAHRAHEEDSPSTKRAAVGRLVGMYDVTAGRAAELFSPQTDLVTTGPASPLGPEGPEGPGFRDREDARQWLELEWQNLLAVAFRLGESASEYVIHLSATLQRFLDVTGRMHEAEALHARAASLADGEPRAQSLVSLAIVYFQLGQHPAAEAPLREALPIHRRSGNRAAESKVLNNLGLVHQHNGDLDEARRRFEAALRMAPSPLAQLFPLGNLAKLCQRLGRHGEALSYAQRALEVAESLGDPTRRAQTLYTVGNQLRAMHRLDEARSALTQSLELARESHFPFCEAYALNALGLVRSALGDPAAAVCLHEEALAVARKFGMAQVETEVRNDLGTSLCRAECAPEALEQHRKALVSARGSGDRLQEARAHEGVGDALVKHDGGSSRAAWSRAQEAYAALGL
ncbi:MAG: tetratricopeptide repeat protein, partial [Phycicoccus sp.]